MVAVSDLPDVFISIGFQLFFPLLPREGRAKPG